jgi:hypothetical protein
MIGPCQHPMHSMPPHPDGLHLYCAVGRGSRPLAVARQWRPSRRDASIVARAVGNLHVPGGRVAALVRHSALLRQDP